MKSKGFTLTELLVVIAIIAVLVVVSIPVFGSQIERSCESSDISNMKSAKDLAIAQYESGFDLDGNIITKDGFTCYFDSSSGILSKDIPAGYGRGTETDAGCEDFQMVINSTDKIPQIIYTGKTNVESKYISIFLNSEGTIKTFWCGNNEDDTEDEVEEGYTPPEDALPYIMTYDNRNMISYTNSSYSAESIFEYDGKKYYFKGFEDDCFKLYSGKIVIPESVSYISENAFSNINRISSFVVDENNKYFVASNNGKILTDINFTKIIRASYKQGDYVIPSTVTSIGAYAFKGCTTNLRKITIPSSVKDIGEGAFYGCSYLQNITIPGSVKTIKANTINMNGTYIHITIEDGVESIEKNAITGTKITISLPNSIKTIYSDSIKSSKTSSPFSGTYNGTTYTSINDLVGAINN